MATKIYPDSFRTLSLDLTESVDFDFFEESQEADRKPASDSQPKTNNNEVDEANECMQLDPSISIQEFRTECATVPPSSPTECAASQSKQEDLCSKRTTRSRSTARSLSHAYESDFSAISTEDEDVDRSSHQMKDVSQPQKAEITSESEALDESGFTNSVPRSQTTPSLKRDEEIERAKAERLEKAMLSLTKRLNNMRVRPPWRDPNSRQLPSDRAASFYELYEQFTQASTECNTPADNRLLPSPSMAVCRPYHTTLNRFREQERIQMENYVLAKRLEKVRPSPGMTRNEQLRQYKRYFISPTLYPARPVSLSRRPESADVASRVDHSGDHSSRNSRMASNRPVSSAVYDYRRGMSSANSRRSSNTSDNYTASSNAKSNKNEKIYRNRNGAASRQLDQMSSEGETTKPKHKVTASSIKQKTESDGSSAPKHRTHHRRDRI